MAGEDFSQRASHDRLSAITDGVYAVALTLLALEIVVPSVNSIHSSSQLNIYVLNNCYLSYLCILLVSLYFQIFGHLLMLFQCIKKWIILFLQ